MKFPLFILSSLFISQFSFASNLDTWQQQAKQQNLANHPYWRILLRYEQQKEAQWQSIVNDKAFFLSAEGQHNSQAELQATLAALASDNITDKAVSCQFPARISWLKTQLQISDSQLPKVDCPALQTWLTGINPHQATLVFAADFINNPSSMFGHTLLRIDTAEQTEDTRLLAYAVNYAAQTNTANGLEFAYKGLTGGYAGAFSILPYYEKVKEYNDFENRDLWEYQLNLSPEEITQGLKHLWEIKRVNFPYYFLSSNCSYQLLGLLEAARPNTYLRQDFPIYAIPTDTLRRVLEEKDILRKLVYRPANGTTLAYHAQQNNPFLNKAAKALAKDVNYSVDHLNSADQARAYEMAYDYLYYLFLAHKVDKDTAPSQLRQLLIKRSQYQIADQRITPPQPKVDPAQGHGTTRLQFGLSHQQDQDISFAEWRPAYQDLLDNDEGYRRGAGIDFLRLRVGYNHSTQQAKLLNFTLLNIDSLASGNDFIQPLSWSFALGLEQEAIDNQQFSEQKQHTVSYVRGGAGVASPLHSQDWLCFALAQGHFQAATAIEDGWRVGVGGKLGCRQQTVHGQLLLDVQPMYYSDHQTLTTTTRAAYQWQYSVNQGVRVQLLNQQQKHKDWQSIEASWVRYF